MWQATVCGLQPRRTHQSGRTFPGLLQTEIQVQEARSCSGLHRLGCSHKCQDCPELNRRFVRTDGRNAKEI